LFLSKTTTAKKDVTRTKREGSQPKAGERPAAPFPTAPSGVEWAASVFFILFVFSLLRPRIIPGVDLGQTISSPFCYAVP
jgi:hypothetical protein